MAGGVFPAFVEVVGTIRADCSRQSFTEDTNATFTRKLQLLGGTTAHHMHYVQRAIDLSMQNFDTGTAMDATVPKYVFSGQKRERRIQR